jgi:hypothetical protein
MVTVKELMTVQIVALIAWLATASFAIAFRRAWRLIDQAMLAEVIDQPCLRERREIALTADLLAGAIPREHYHASMARLAEPDGDLPDLVTDPRV